MRPIEIDPATEIAVRCSHYISPTDFWLQFNDDGGQKLQNLRAQLTDYHKNGLLKLHSVVNVAQLVAVVLLKEVHRGEVISIALPNVEILLVDLGEIVVSPMQSLFVLPDELKSLCNQAVHCKLRLIEEPEEGWKPEQIKLLWTDISSDSGETFQAVFVPEESDCSELNRIPVELYNRITCRSINIKFGIATKTLNLEPQNQIDVNCSAKVFLGIVSHVSQEGFVYVQKISDAKRLDQLQHQLEVLSNSRFSHDLESLPTFFGVVSGGKFFRANLLCKINQQLKVLFIDYGFNAIIDVSDCFSIPSCLQYPPIATAFLIDQRIKDRLSEDQLLAIKDFLGSSNVSVTPIQSSDSSGFVTAEITLCNSRMRLSEWLERREIPLSVLSAPNSPDSFANANGHSAATVNECNQIDRLELSSPFAAYNFTSLKAGCSYSALCCATEMPGAAYFQLEKDKPVLDAISSMMSGISRLDFLPISTSTAIASTPVVFRQNNNDCLYRGELCCFNFSTNICQIFAVDYGTVENIHLSNVFTASQKICRIPVCCIKIVIDDFGPFQNTVKSNLTGARCSLRINSVSSHFISASVLFTESSEYLTIETNGVENFVEPTNSTSGLSGSFCSNDTRLTPLKIAYVAKSPPSQSFTASITHIENLCSFYLLLDEDSQLLRKTMADVQEVAKKAEKLNGDLYAGQPCIAMYTEDSKWYRAALIANLENAQFVVKFVDYGNIALVPPGFLLQISQEALTCCAFALHCRLVGCDLRNYREEAITSFRKLINMPLCVTVIEAESNPIGVRLEINEQDILSDLPTIASLSNPVSAESEFTMSLNMDANHLPTETHPHCKARVSQAKLSGWFRAVTSIAKPNSGNSKQLHLWIQLSSELTCLNELLNKLEIVATSAIKINKPKIGELCLGFFEGNWYRAEVKAVYSDSVRVLFIDYGNEEEGTLDELQLKALPQCADLYRDAFAFECIIVSPDGCCFSAEACDKLVELGEIDFIIEFSTPCDLPTVSAEMSVLESITTSAVSIVDSTATLVETIDESEANKSKIPTIQKCKPGNTISGVVSIALPMADDNSRLHLWIQSCSDLDALNSLQSQIDAVATSADLLIEPMVGQFCIGLFEGGWYRAEVKAVYSDSVRVLFIDYGNEEEGTLDELQLKALPQCADLYRDAFAFECIIVSPDGCCFSAEACDKLVELGEIDFIIEFSTPCDLPTVSAEMSVLESITTSAVSIVDSTATLVETIDESEANKSKIPTIQKCKPGNTISGVVSIALPMADDNSRLHLWIQSCSDLDALNSLQSQIDAVATSADLLIEPMVGQFCIGLFEGGWYRAEVKAVYSDSVRVLFIDYGNEEEGTLDELQLKALPQCADLYRDAFAFECIIVSPDGCCFSAEACDKLVELGEIDFIIEFSTPCDLPTVSAEMSVLESITTSAVSIVDSTATLVETIDESEANKSKIPTIQKCKPGNTVSGVVSIALPMADDNSRLHLWIQSCSDLDALNGLQSQIDAVATSADLLIEPMVGQFCIGLFEGGWYRAEVKAVYSDSVRVLFIDYGNEEEGTLDELQLKALPQCADLYRDAFAFECIIVSPDGCCFSAEACDKLVELGEIDFIIEFSTPCDLPTVSAEMSVLESITTSAVSIVDSTATLVETIDESEANKSKIPTIQKCKPGNTISGVVSIALPMADDNSRLHLWIQSCSDLDALNSLQSQIDAVATSADLLIEPMVGQFCIGLFEGGWYRAEVKAVYSDSVRVLFIDYGNEEEGTLDELQLKALPQCADLYRDAFAFECIIVSPDGCCFSAEACDKLVELGEIDFIIEFSTPCDLPTVSAEMSVLESITTSAVSIVDSTATLVETIDESEANKSKIPTIQKCKPGNTVSGVVSIALPMADDNSRLHLWIQSCSDLDALNGLQSQIDAVATSADLLIEPMVGQFCIGLFEGGWYRAEVKAVYSDSVRVLFIDYGNEEEGTLDELQLKALPQCADLYRDAFAFECIIVSPDGCCFSAEACDKLVEFIEINFVIQVSSLFHLPLVSSAEDLGMFSVYSARKLL